MNYCYGKGSRRVSFVESCPFLRGSFIGGSTAVRESVPSSEAFYSLQALHCILQHKDILKQRLLNNNPFNDGLFLCCFVHGQNNLNQYAFFKPE